MMRKLFFLVLLAVLTGGGVFSQIPDTLMTGSVTYVTSQHIYVRFTSTDGIRPGDTLFSQASGQWLPHALVKELSSISCVCTPFAGVTTTEKMMLGIRRHAESEPVPAVVAGTVTATTGSKTMTGEAAPSPKDTVVPKEAHRQSIHGYFSIAAYSGFSSEPSTNLLKMKYTLAINAGNIGGSGFSAEGYINFIHKDNNWNEIADDIFNGLRIYNLAVKYEYRNKLSVTLGRKINPKLSNMGANDGLQAEIRFRPLSVGLIAGFRPDYQNYGFNANLFQTGLYLFNEYRGRFGSMQSTAAFIQQSNSGMTDRRFIYLQHVNALLKKVLFFASAEADLYRMNFDATDSSYKGSNTVTLSNLYISLNWNILRSLSVNASYSARSNVIYYETYKSYLDRLLDTEMMQGYAVNISYRPLRFLSLGANGAWRFRPSDPRDTRNVHLYATYAGIPWLETSVTGSFTLLETGYLSGKVYSLGISRDFFKSRLSPDLTYRYVDYRYQPGGMKQPQNLIEGSISWRFYRKFSFSVYYEGTFEKVEQFNRLYARLNLGF